MAAFVVRRLLISVVVLFFVTLIGFSITHVLPGDPVTSILGETASPQARVRVRQELNLNDPVPVQYGKWVWGALHLDFGKTFREGRPVGTEIRTRLAPTLELGLLSIGFSFTLGILLGVVAAVNRNGPLDHLARFVGVIGVATPNFWLGLLLIVLLAVKLRLLPAFGYVPFDQSPAENLKRMIMPVFAISLAQLAVIVRISRGTMIEVLGEDFVRTARAKGLPGLMVMRRHVLKNGMIPVLTVAGLQVARVAGGAAVVETVFAIPGIGRLTAEAVQGHEYNVVQAVMLLSGVVIVAANMLVDMSYGWLDPRIRFS
ncbi:MAG TPA: ABC transporter permease [Dehalococcoidia bacterium]|nr:ABC transporter permease [Dehalococcoidia bacterium]